MVRSLCDSSNYYVLYLEQVFRDFNMILAAKYEEAVLFTEELEAELARWLSVGGNLPTSLTT